METLWNEVEIGAKLTFRALIPPADKRIPLTLRNGIMPVVCYLPLVFMAYLARRSNTYLIRLLLLPLTICTVLCAAYRFVWTQPLLNLYNWGHSLMAAIAISKAIEYALTREGMLKVGESRPGVFKGKMKVDALSEPAQNGFHSVEEPSQHIEYLPCWLSDALELLTSIRVHYFKFGKNTYVPRIIRPLDSRRTFLIATFKSFIISYCTFDFLESIIKLFPGGIGTPLGGSMFYPQLPAPFPRYFVSTLVHIMTGFALLSGFDMVYDLCTLFAVGVIGTPPMAWPPLIEQPWLAESMHELWARRWHQCFRQTFLVYGAYAGRWLFEVLATCILAPFTVLCSSVKHSRKVKVAQFGGMGMLLGTFVASGLVHECGMYTMNRGFDFMPILFFALQGPILMGERIWREVTGKRVGGWAGRLWVYFVMLVMAQPMIDSWHRRGLGGGMLLPPIVSPTRIFVVPLLGRFVPRLECLLGM